MLYREHMESLAKIVGGQLVERGLSRPMVVWTRGDGRLVVDDGSVLIAVGAFKAADPDLLLRTDSLLSDWEWAEFDHCELAAEVVLGRVVPYHEGEGLVVWTRGDGACVVLVPGRLEVFPSEDAMAAGSPPSMSVPRRGPDTIPSSDCPGCQCSQPGDNVVEGCEDCARYVATCAAAV